MTVDLLPANQRQQVPFEAVVSFAIILATEEYVTSVLKKENLSTQEYDTCVLQVARQIMVLRSKKQLKSKDNHHAIEQKNLCSIWIRAIEILEYGIYHPSVIIYLMEYDLNKSPLPDIDRITDDGCFIRLQFEDILKNFGKYEEKDVLISATIIDVLHIFKQRKVNSYRGIGEGLDLVLDVVDYVFGSIDQFPDAFKKQTNEQLNELISHVMESLNIPIESKEDIKHIRFCVRPQKGKSDSSEDS
jgi:hypothetical protein